MRRGTVDSPTPATLLGKFQYTNRKYGIICRVETIGDGKMSLTLTAEPAIIDGARSYAEHSGFSHTKER